MNLFSKKPKITNCWKCGVSINSSDICTKCEKVSLSIHCYKPFPGALRKLHKYIWYDGIEDNGIGWFKKARDQLIKKIAAKDLKIEQKAKRERMKLKEKVDGWKK